MNPILSLKLVNTATRPIYVYQIGRIEVKALFDTGAAAPVWCTGEKMLKEAYPDVEKIAKQCMIGGFGGLLKKCDIFRIPKYPYFDPIFTQPP